MKRGNVHSLLLGGLAAVALIMSATMAQAFDFKLGEVDAKLDSTISFGMGIRTSGRDCSFVAIDNGGCTSTGNIRSNNQGKGGNG
jgi:hypothetical protein